MAPRIPRAGPRVFQPRGVPTRHRQGSPTGTAAPATPELGFTRTALPDQYPTRSAGWPIGTSGTWLLVGSVTSIGSSKGTIARTFQAGTRGVIWRFGSATTLEALIVDSGGSNDTTTHTHGSSMLSGSDRAYLTWEPSGSDTAVELGFGASSSAGTVSGGLATGTPSGTDAGVFDQDGSINRAITGTGLLFLAFSAKLTPAQRALSVGDLLALPSLVVCPQPDQADEESVTSATEQGSAAGTYSIVDGPTVGTTNPMTVAEVTG